MKTIISKAMFALLLLVGGTQVCRAEVSDTDFEKLMEKYLATEKGKENIAKAFQSYVVAARAKAQQDESARETKDMEEQFKNPVKIDLGSSPVRGLATAKVTIVEFSDFQCPYCKRGADTIAEVAKLYPNDVKLVFKNFPLEFHPHAEPAARAAYAAGKQGKFWEMHDELFANQARLGDDLYLELAKKLSLNVDKFKTDMASEDAKASVKADLKAGQAVGIQGTPGFSVNGVLVKGAYPVEHFKTIIDKWLGKSEKAQG